VKTFLSLNVIISIIVKRAKRLNAIKIDRNNVSSHWNLTSIAYFHTAVSSSRWNKMKFISGVDLEDSLSLVATHRKMQQLLRIRR